MKQPLEHIVQSKSGLVHCLLCFREIERLEEIGSYVRYEPSFVLVADPLDLFLLQGQRKFGQSILQIAIAINHIAVRIMDLLSFMQPIEHEVEGQ